MTTFIVGQNGLTLEQAISAANADSNEPHTITFDESLKGSEIKLTQGSALTRDITINGDIDGDGRADVTLDGDFETVAFVVRSGATAVLESITLTQAGTFFGAIPIRVESGGMLTIRNSTFEDNGSRFGSGVVSNEGTLVVENSLFSDNFTIDSNGGAISNAAGASLTITNSTFIGNSSSGLGGAIYNEGTANVTNSTITGNRAALGTDVDPDGGGIANADGGTFNLTNSIVVANFGGTFNAAQQDTLGTITLLGANQVGLSGTSVGQLFAATATTDVGQLTGALADNGGPVKTIALNPNSANPALDAAPANLAPATDGRGGARAIDLTDPTNELGPVDLGAYELGVPTVTVTAFPAVLEDEPDSSVLRGFTLSLPALPALDGPSGAFTTVVFNLTGTADVIDGGSGDYTVSDSGASNVIALGNNRYTADVPYGGSANVLLSIAPDFDPESDEGVILTLEQAAVAQTPADVGYAIGTANSAQFVITDDDPLAELSISSANTTLTEGGAALEVVISIDDNTARTPPTSAAVEIVGGSGDFADPLLQDVDFAVGATTATLTFETFDDAVVEDQETFTIRLVTPDASNEAGGYILGATPSFTVTVDDNDAALLYTVAFESATGGTIAEGETGEAAAVVLTDASGNPFAAPAGGLLVEYAVVVGGDSGAGEANVDFATLSGQVIVPEGQTRAGIDLRTFDDEFVEGDATFDFTLTPTSVREEGRNYDVDPMAATSQATLTSDDAFTTIIRALDLTTDEAGGTASVSVQLATPIDNGSVIVVVFQTEDSEDEVAPATPFVTPDGVADVSEFIATLDRRLFGETTPFEVSGLFETDSIANATNAIVYRADQGDGEALQYEDGTFSDFNVVKTATFQGLDDNDVDGDQTSALTVTVVEVDVFDFDARIIGTTQFFDLDGSAVNGLTFTNVDDDSPAVLVSDPSGSVSEADTSQTATYTLGLTTNPGGTVVIDLTADADVEISLDGVNFASTAQASFTDLTAQTVTVRAVNDTDVEGDLAASITHVISVGTTDYPTTLPIGVAAVTVIDDDTPTVSIGQNVTSASEESEVSGFVPIQLDAPAPSGGLTVAYAISGATTPSAQSADNGVDYITLSGTVLVAEGETGVNLEIAPIFDQFDEQPFEEVTITLSAGSAYQLGTETSATVQIFDNDQAGFTILESGAQTIINEGGTETYTIQLTSEPTADVTITVVASGSVQPASGSQTLTFTPANWDTPQTVTLELENDDTPGSNGGVQTISHTVASTDPDYSPTALSPITPRDVSVQTIDNDSAAILFNNPGGIILREDGSPASDAYTVALQGDPTADVIISAAVVSPTPSPSFTLSPSNDDGNGNLVLTKDNPSGSFTVTRVADDVDYTNLVPTDFQITHTVTSADTAFAGLTVPTIDQITLTEDDQAGITVVPLGTSDTTVLEGDANGDSFTVQLDSEPQSQVSIQLDSARSALGDPGALNIEVDGVARGTKTDLVFNATNWNVPQVVKLTKFISDNIDGDVDASGSPYDAATFLTGDPFTVDLIQGFTTTSPEYLPVTAPTLTVTVADDDVVGITVTQTNDEARVVEGGSSDTFTVVLDSEPLNDVVISFGGDTGEFETIADLTFTPANWNVAQTVTLTALTDADVGDETVNLTYAAASADPKYDPLSGGFSVTIEELADRGDLADGLSAALSDLESIVDTTLNFELPLFDVGAGLPNFFQTFTNVLVDTVRNDQSGSIADLGEAMATAIEGAFSGIGITLDATVTPTINLGEVAFDITLGNTYSTSLALNADFGVPAVGFNIEGSIDPSYGYQLGLGFGISEELGFFIDTATTGFTANIGAELNDTFTAGGNIAFLGVDATNNTDDDGASLTSAGVDFGVAVNDLDVNDGTSRVKISDFSAASASEIFDLSLSADTNLSLNVVTSLDENAVLPNFSFDLDGAWTALELNDQGQFDIGAAPTLGFNNIQVDTGSFLTGFADPVFRRVDAILDPLRPIIDILQTDLVILDKLGINRVRGNTIDTNGDGTDTLVEFLQAAGGGQINVARFINAIDEIANLSADIIDLLDDADQNGTNIIVDVGSFDLGLSDDTFDAEEGEAGFDQAQNGVQNGSSSSGTGQVTNQINNSQTLTTKAKTLLNNLSSNEFFSVPILTDGESVFGLLTGQTDVSLFEFDVPPLEVGSSFGVGFNVFGILKGDLSVSASILGDFAFGFDTQGFFDWAATGYDPAQSYRIFDGFFISDVDDSGADVDEIIATLEFSGGVEANAWIARGFVRAGIEGTATVDFRDTGESSGTGDGKIRAISEIGAQLATPWNLFNLAGAISAFATGEGRAFGVKLGSFYVSQELLRIEYGVNGLQFSSVFDGPVVGATAFFDANFNGVRDADEPFTITGNDEDDPTLGSFNLAIPLEIYDHNGNGVIDPNEGRIVIVEGFDIDTQQTQDVPYITAAGWSVASPFTLLATELAPTDPAAVEAAVEAALGLPAAFDLRNGDPLAGLLSDDADAAAVFKVLAQLQNLIILGANTLGPANDPTPAQLVSGNFDTVDPDLREEGAIQIVVAIAAEVLAGNTVDLTNAASLQALVEAAATALSVTPTDLAAAVTDMAARNAAIAAVSGTGTAARDAIAAQIANDQLDQSYGYTLENIFARLLGASAPAPDVAGAATQVETAFGLPVGVDITSFDTIVALETGDANALEVYAQQVSVNATLIQLAALGNGDAGSGGEAAALAALVDAVENATQPIDLGDQSTVESLIAQAVPGADPAIAQKAAETIAQTNAEIAQIVDNAGPNPDLGALRQQIAQVQALAQDEQADLIQELGAKTVTEEAFDVRLTIAERASVEGLLTLTTDEDTVLSTNVLTDLEADLSDDYSIIAVAGQPGDVGATLTLASGALLTLTTDGAVTYNPNAQFEDLRLGESGAEAVDVTLTRASDNLQVEATIEFVVTGLEEAGTRRAELFAGFDAGTELIGTSSADILSVADAIASGDLSTDANTGALVDGRGANDIILGGAGADALLGEDGDDDISGLAGVDELFGELGDDFLTGGADADVIDGGLGFDTAAYLDSASGVDVRLWRGDVAQRSGDAEGDTLSGIERVVGSRFSDGLAGANGQENSLGGKPGDDFLFGANLGDNLFGGAGQDLLEGRNGDDVLGGGPGADLINGGLGRDQADYKSSREGVDVRLWRDGAQEAGDAQGDVLTSVEIVVGSDFADGLAGRNGQSNDLFGRGGGDFLFGANRADLLVGGAGADTLTGRNGADRLEGGADADLMTGGNGADVFVLTSGDGADTITDFADGQDRLELVTGRTITSIDQLTLVEANGAVTISGYGLDGDEVVLQGLSVSQLGAADFVFL